MSEPLYFGCSNYDVGHYVFDKDLKWADARATHNFARNDGKLCVNKDVQPEGKANVAWCEDYAILAFWDRSVDTRRGSNVMFLIPYEFLPAPRAAEDVVRVARETFPLIFGRFKYPVEVVSQGTYKQWTGGAQ